MCEYHDTDPTCASSYLWPFLREFIASKAWPQKKAFDLGCGNGATCKMLSQQGFEVVGVDPSESGVRLAKASGVNAHVGSAYDDLASIYGTFPLVVSLEVIEHCMEPRKFAKTIYELVAPGGYGFISTPYHGYLKNLALAVSGNMDRHFTALWDGGHIKFFSVKTLTALMREAGAKDLKFVRVGRVPPLAKTMVCIYAAPATASSKPANPAGREKF
jgi:2-polyprenyl-3-methyl-5-hydroxy-6-metoxy-1,4-benzoquinol methylase